MWAPVTPLAIVAFPSCGRSSVGRASRCQREGRRFEPGRPLQAGGVACPAAPRGLRAHASPPAVRIVVVRQLAAWPSGLGRGLQSPLPGFDSRRRLQGVSWEILSLNARKPAPVPDQLARQRWRNTISPLRLRRMSGVSPRLGSGGVSVGAGSFRSGGLQSPWGESLLVGPSR